MRTIKFRARRKNGKWVVGNFINHFYTYFKTEERNSIFLPKPENDNGGYWVEDIDPETIGQFTGLYDCEGKEIYEGDILLISDFSKVACEFRHGAFGYQYCNDFNSFAGNTNFTFNPKNSDESFEIIGNIHDNPELLKGDKR